MSEPLSHIVTKDGKDYRISDVEARYLIDQVKNQIGNVDLSNLNVEFPTDPKFDTVTIGSYELNGESAQLLAEFVESVIPIEGMYF